MRQQRARKASAVAEALIGLGSNLGDRAAALAEAVAALDRLPKTKVLRVSSWLETRPAGGPPDQPAYLNGAAVVETSLGPRILLSRLQSIEKQLGRTSQQRWSPRIIDLDLLLFGSRSIQSPSLTLPHPRMVWRRFVLEPAAAIAPQWVHPLNGWTLAQLRAHLDQSLPLVIITGPRPAAAAELASRLHALRPHDTRLIAPPEGWITGAAAAHPRLTARQLESALEQWSKTTAQLRRAAPAARGGDDIGEVFDLCSLWIGWLRGCARVCLGIQEYAEFTDRWQRTRTAGPRPRLVVAFDPPPESAVEPGAASEADTAADGPRDEGPGEDEGDETDDRCSTDGASDSAGDRDSAASAADWPAAFWDELRRPDVGPTMQLNGVSFDDALIELFAALEAMQP